jgi:hypothetical protein
MLLKCDLNIKFHAKIDIISKVNSISNLYKLRGSNFCVDTFSSVIMTISIVVKSLNILKVGAISIVTYAI